MADVAGLCPRAKRQDDARHRAERAQRGAGPREIDDSLLLVERPLLARKLDRCDHRDAVEAVRPALPRPALARERRAPVGPDPGLDRVEDVGDPHRLARPADGNVHAVERLLALGEEADPLLVDVEIRGREARKLPGHYRTLLPPSSDEISAAVPAQARPAAASRAFGSRNDGPETDTAATHRADASKTGAATAWRPSSSSSTAIA